MITNIITITIKMIFPAIIILLCNYNPKYFFLSAYDQRLEKNLG